MERYRSILGTASVVVVSLYVAARIPHPGNFEQQSRRAHLGIARVTTGAGSAGDRLDPPFALYMRPSATAAETAILTPRMTGPMPTGMTMTPVLPGRMQVAAGVPPTPGSSHRPTIHSVIQTRQARPWRNKASPVDLATARPGRQNTIDLSSRDLVTHRDDNG